MTKKRLLFIKKIYQELSKRISSSKSKLIIHPTLSHLQKSYGKFNKFVESPHAFFDSNNNTIHISYSTTNLEELVWLFLHEFSHIYALNKYGENNYRWADSELSEQYANNRANKWIKKLRKEGWFSKFIV